MGGVKINRAKRKLVHELWNACLLSPVVLARSQLDWIMRAHKEGFTPGELKFLDERHDELVKMHEDLIKVYYRLKK